MSDSANKAPLHCPVHGRGDLTSIGHNRWMIGLASLCLVLFAIIARVSYSSYQSALFAKAYHYSVPALNQTGTALSAKLKGYENLSMQFLANQDLNNMLARYVSSRDMYDVSRFNQAFAKFLDGYAFNDSCLYETLFFDESSAPHKTLTMGEALPNDFIRSFRETGSFKRIADADGQPVWLIIKSGETGSPHLALGRRIKHLFTGRPLGVLVLLLSEKNLDYFINATRYNDESFTRKKMATDYYLLVGPDGRVLSSPFKNQLGRPANSIIGRGLPPRWLPPDAATIGRFIHGVGDDQILVTYQAISPGKLHLLNIVASSSARRINSGSMSSVLNPIPALLLAAILLIAALVLLIRRSRPVQPGRSAGDGAAAPGAHFGNSFSVYSPSAPKAASAPAWMADLTHREREILCLMAQGLDNKQIARQLYVAEQTVKNYVSVIYGKLGVHDRVQASLKAIETGLCQPATETIQRDRI